MIWILFAAVTACVILAIARPLARRAAPALGPASEIEAYKLQLAELGRDEEAGGIGKSEASQMRAEISRRLLKASRESASAAFSGKPVAFDTNYALAALAAFIALGAAGGYAFYGEPGLPDQPLEARISAPPSQQPLAIQMANVERRLRQAPDDAAGWNVIAPLYFRTGQFDKSANAYRQAMRLSGQDEDKLLGLFEALIYGNEGNVTPEAKSVLDKALAKTPNSLRGRAWLAIAAAQEGNKAEAKRVFREMLSENPPADWKGVIFKQLAALDEAPDAPAQAKGSAPVPGPAALAAQAAGNQLPSVDAMVERLAARLKQNPGEVNGWLMLIRSYMALKLPEKTQEAIAAARKQFASNSGALGQIDALVKEFGDPGTAAENQAPSVSQAPAAAPEGGQSEMIRGMVARLAGKLKDNGADLDGWLRLIRSYSVLSESAKAQEAAVSARKQFASEPEALEKIAALTRELGIEAADGKGEQPKP